MGAGRTVLFSVRGCLIAPQISQDEQPPPTAGTLRRDFAVDVFTVILLLIAFAVGYGVREMISRRRHRGAARRRQNRHSSPPERPEAPSS